MLFEAAIANAAAVGSSPADAVVIVSRRLLDEMDRDETQGVLAHLIASIGNGDLGIALMMVTVFRTFGLVNTLLDAPISSSARKTLWQLIAVIAGRGQGDDAVRAARVAELLGARVSEMEMEDVDLVLGDEAQKARAPRGITGLLLKVRVYAMFPVWAASGMAKTALMIMAFSLLSPLLSWTWRTRRYLADATAVQLTRNPDGIARGLQELLTRGGGITGGAWADHLFIVGGSTVRTRRHERRSEALRQQIERDTAGKKGASRLFAAINSQYQVSQERRAEILAEAEREERTEQEDRQESTDGLHSWISPHPSLQRRLKRLQAQGAHVDSASFGRPGPTPKQIFWMVAIFGPLIALCVVLMSIAVVLATGLTIVFMMIPLAIVYAIFELLF
jgi:Zn-dependent protease with chaperone function